MSKEPPIFDVDNATRIDPGFARCECDYDLLEHNGKFAIMWDTWSHPPPTLLIYEDETEARRNFEDLRSKKTDYWELSQHVKKEYQVDWSSPFWDEDEE